MICFLWRQWHIQVTSYDFQGVILFASEAKNLVGLTDKIMPFPPGHYYRDGKFICYSDIAGVETICRDDLETACKHIREKLVAGVEKRLVADAKVGFLQYILWSHRRK